MSEEDLEQDGFGKHPNGVKCFGFDHGIALSITHIFNCTMYL